MQVCKFKNLWNVFWNKIYWIKKLKFLLNGVSSIGYNSCLIESINWNFFNKRLQTLRFEIYKCQLHKLWLWKGWGINLTKIIVFLNLWKFAAYRNRCKIIFSATENTAQNFSFQTFSIAKSKILRAKVNFRLWSWK